MSVITYEHTLIDKSKYTHDDKSSYSLLIKLLHNGNVTICIHEYFAINYQNVRKSVAVPTNYNSTIFGDHLFSKLNDPCNVCFFASFRRKVLEQVDMRRR